MRYFCIFLCLLCIVACNSKTPTSPEPQESSLPQSAVTVPAESANPADINQPAETANPADINQPAGSANPADINQPTETSDNNIQAMESESSREVMKVILPYAQTSIDSSVNYRGDFGLIIAVVTKDGISVRSLGDLADLPSPQTAWGEIGSITKVFTGMALASMVNEGLVTLDTPLSTCLPTGMTIDGLDKITLGMLTTHTSGLPRLPDGTINLLKFLNLSDPYVNYSIDNLWDDLATSKRNEPGEFEYSNFAVSVLGHALAVCAHEKSWQDLIDHRVIQVLGLHDVRLESPKPLIQGHTNYGTPASEWHYPKMGMAPAGAYRANIMALVKLVQKLISTEDDPGQKLIQTAIQPITSNVPKDMAFSAIGMNWFRGIGHINAYLKNPDVKEILSKLVWHSGLTRGYGAFVAALPEKQLGIAILSDTSCEYSTLAAMIGLGRLLGESQEDMQKLSDHIFKKDRVSLAHSDESKE